MDTSQKTSDRATSGRSFIRAAKAHVIDAVLVIVAFAFGAVSLTYPFGHDQALYAYVGREWAQRGAIPYRDVFDHKTPAIYVLHAISATVFGDNEWGIRVLDLFGVAALGAVVARLVTARGERVKPGLRGVGILAASLLYYGFFDYWNTAQSELWYGMLGLASITCALRIAKSTRAQVLAGLVGATAMIMKPPAIGFVALAALMVVVREREDRDGRLRRSLLGVARFGGGFALPVALMFGYFGAHHALSAMADIVIGANGYYVAHERGVQTLGEVLNRTFDFYSIFSPLSTFLLFGLVIGIAFGVKRRDARLRARYGLALVLCFLGFGAVAMQQKFYWLHWSVMIAPLCFLTTAVLDDLVRSATKWVRESRLMAAAGALLIVFYASTSHSGAMATWGAANLLAYRYHTGAITRADYDEHFKTDWLYFYYRDLDDVSRYIREHSTPDDTICVRGFNPEVYILAHRHYGGRFYWTNFLVDPRRAYRREAYLAEDQEAFARTKPKFVVTLTVFHDGLNSSEYHEPLGYKVVATFDKLAVMERTIP